MPASASPVAEIGVSLPEVLPPGTALPDVAGLARVAEQAGLDGVWAADRLVNGDLSTLDSTLTLAATAAVTRRPRWPGNWTGTWPKART